MTSKLFIAFAALAAASGTAQASSVNLAVNGSFEQGALGIGGFQGWTTNLGDISTFVDSSGITGSLYGDASDGIWSAYFGSTAADGGAFISQNLATNPSQVYVLAFDLANNNGGLPPMNSFTASAGGVTLFSVSNLANQNFVHEQFTFVAAGTTTTLQLFGSNDQSYFDLDNVTVSAAPEPSTLALTAVCPLLLYLCLRKRPRLSGTAG